MNLNRATLLRESAPAARSESAAASLLQESRRGEGGGEESRVGGGSADGRIEPNIGSIVTGAIESIFSQENVQIHETLKGFFF